MNSHIRYCIFVLTFVAIDCVKADDIVIADFESGSYEGWTTTGDCFGAEPAEGTLPNQMKVTGFYGNRLVNTFRGGDKATGTATSSPFAIQRSHIAFLIGGGPHKGKTGIELLVNGASVRSASGPESEELQWSSWDVEEFAGATVQLRIFDRHAGGWGHINVDQIIQTNLPPSPFDLEDKLAEYRRLPDYMNEPLRPQFHFSPEINWMNDPNGLVYHNGEYHLFHQYNPAGNSWGHMSWGHAVSRDLVHWKHLPLAIPEEHGVMAFSGCCVVDHRDTSGFGSETSPPLVAIYTGHGYGKQVQNLAFSLDDGRTWTKYGGNPVLDINKKDFRDPKVFWHGPTKRWIMVVSLAAEKVLIFYASSDLKSWSELSRFGPAGAKGKPNWECPDLFPLKVEDSDEQLWVLEADMGSGSIAGGSGGEYFVGTFDGKAFIPIQDAKWVDYGRDFYAPISWSDITESDGRRIWIGWFNNWQTCLVPTSPWRSCMSIPRSLGLRKVSVAEGSEQYVLIQKPVAELQKLESTHIKLDTANIGWPPRAVTSPGQIEDRRFVVRTTLKPGKARSCGFRIRTGHNEFTEIGYDRGEDLQASHVYVDRRKSGNVAFHPAFAGRHDAPVRLVNDAVKLEIFVDRSSVEVFVNDGEAVISDRIFPTGTTVVLEAFAGDESAAIADSVVSQVLGVW